MRLSEQQLESLLGKHIRDSCPLHSRPAFLSRRPWFGTWLRTGTRAHLPPTPKDIIDAALASSRMPMADPSCKGFGTEIGDKTIGRYLAGYLAELSEQDDRNAMTTSVEQATENGEPVYKCRLTIRHAKGEDVWSWGIQFTANRSDGLLKAASFQCVGAG